ncbi:DUF3618 domain-containing protein [Rhodococcus sp. NPDC047139]|uniref:DUF3618 domain-containing protein n=1 Tax=Rhodococcus sp. NPDC047139 TaxID=3155141 RepID=UPI0033FB7596
MTTPDNDGPPEATEIERQRAELAATVGELTDRLDVPTRVRQSAADQAEAVRKRPDLIAAAAGAVVTVVVVVSVLQRRRRK